MSDNGGEGGAPRRSMVCGGIIGVQEVARVIREGGVVLYPTETVYGLGCDPRATEAIRRIERLKGREPGKPMLILTDTWSRVMDWIGGDVEGRVSPLAGLPITFLLPASETAPYAVVGPTKEVGVRCTTDPFCRELIRVAECPIVSTSANRSGEPAPVTLDDVDKTLIGGVDLVVPASGRFGGVASTILRVSGNKYVLVREGAVSGRKLHSLLGESFVDLDRKSVV